MDGLDMRLALEERTLDALLAVLRDVAEGMKAMNSSLDKLVADWEAADERDDYADWDEVC